MERYRKGLSLAVSVSKINNITYVSTYYTPIVWDWKVTSITGSLISTVNHIFHHILWTTFSKLRGWTIYDSHGNNQPICVVFLWLNYQTLADQHQYFTPIITKIHKRSPSNDIFHYKFHWKFLIDTWTMMTNNNHLKRKFQEEAQ